MINPFAIALNQHQPKLLCAFEYPVIIRYEYCPELAKAIGNDPATAQREIRDHRLFWDRPSFARDDIDDGDQKLLPFLEDIIVQAVERRYVPAELATVGRRRQKLVVYHVGGQTVGYYGGLATSIEQAIRWVDTGEGLPAPAWQAVRS